MESSENVASPAEKISQEALRGENSGVKAITFDVSLFCLLARRTTVAREASTSNWGRLTAVRPRGALKADFNSRPMLLSWPRTAVHRTFFHRADGALGETALGFHACNAAFIKVWCS